MLSEVVLVVIVIARILKLAGKFKKHQISASVTLSAAEKLLGNVF